MRVDPQRGYLAARTVQALAIGGGLRHAALAYAQGAGPEWREVAKTLVDPMDTATGGGIVGPSGADLMAYLWPLSVAGRLALRRVPLAVRMLSEDGAVGAGYVDEYAPIPIAAESFSTETLDAKPKIGAATVITAELARSSDPDALAVIRTAIGRAGSAALDRQFLDPALDGGTGQVGPNSVTSGATPTASTGSSLAQIDADLGDTLDALVAAGSDLTAAAWVLNTRTAAYLSRLRGTGGALAYPQVSVKGGMLFGLPVVTSGGVPISDDTAAETTISLVDAAQIWFGTDAAEISVSEQAAVAMDSDPEGKTLISLWQRELVGVRLLLHANWKARSGAVQVVSGVAY